MGLLRLIQHCLCVGSIFLILHQKWKILLARLMQSVSAEFPSDIHDLPSDLPSDIHSPSLCISPCWICTGIMQHYSGGSVSLFSELSVMGMSAGIPGHVMVMSAWFAWSSSGVSEWHSYWLKFQTVQSEYFQTHTARFIWHHCWVQKPSSQKLALHWVSSLSLQGLREWLIRNRINDPR